MIGPYVNKSGGGFTSPGEVKIGPDFPLDGKSTTSAQTEAEPASGASFSIDSPGLGGEIVVFRRGTPREMIDSVMSKRPGVVVFTEREVDYLHSEIEPSRRGPENSLLRAVVAAKRALGGWLILGRPDLELLEEASAPSCEMAVRTEPAPVSRPSHGEPEPAEGPSPASCGDSRPTRPTRRTSRANPLPRARKAPAGL